MIKGTMLLGEGNPGMALRQFARAIEIKPNCGPCYFQAGVALIRQEEFEQAYESFQKACSLGFKRGCDQAQRMEERRRRRGR
jgi:Flp pilus assembly protein TadD